RTPTPSRFGATPRQRFPSPRTVRPVQPPQQTPPDDASSAPLVQRTSAQRKGPVPRAQTSSEDSSCADVKPLGGHVLIPIVCSLRGGDCDIRREHSLAGLRGSGRDISCRNRVRYRLQRHLST